MLVLVIQCLFPAGFRVRKTECEFEYEHEHEKKKQSGLRYRRLVLSSGGAEPVYCGGIGAWVAVTGMAVAARCKARSWTMPEVVMYWSRTSG